MESGFPTKELKEEDDRLMRGIFSRPAGMSADEYIEKNASESYKKYIRDYRERKERLYKKGIIIN